MVFCLSSRCNRFAYFASVCLFIRLVLCLFVWSSVYLSVYISACISVFFCVRLSIVPSMFLCLFVRLSVCLPFVCLSLRLFGFVLQHRRFVDCPVQSLRRIRSMVLDRFSLTAKLDPFPLSGRCPTAPLAFSILKMGRRLSLTIYIAGCLTLFLLSVCLWVTCAPLSVCLSFCICIFLPPLSVYVCLSLYVSSFFLSLSSFSPLPVFLHRLYLSLRATSTVYACMHACLFLCHFVYLSAYILLYVFIFVCLIMHEVESAQKNNSLSVCLFRFPCLCLSVYLSFSVCPFRCPNVTYSISRLYIPIDVRLYASLYLFVCLSVYIYVRIVVRIIISSLFDCVCIFLNSSST